MESICFIQLSEKKKKSQTLYFVSASAFFSLSYLYTVSSKSVSTSFLAQSRILAKNSESLVAMTHNGNCCEDFL